MQSSGGTSGGGARGDGSARYSPANRGEVILALALVIPVFLFMALSIFS